MPALAPRIPSYRHQKSRDLAVVCINGRDIYLGKFKSPESQRKYDKLIQEWLASGRVLTSETPIDEEAFSIAELIVAYMQHAKVIYQKDGKRLSVTADGPCTDVNEHHGETGNPWSFAKAVL